MQKMQQTGLIRPGLQNLRASKNRFPQSPKITTRPSAPQLSSPPLSNPPRQSEAWKCTLCRQRYKDPKILPCFHTFCTECLESVVSLWILEDNRDSTKEFFCPICLKAFDLPKSLSELDDNTYIPNQEYQECETQRLIYCQMCTEDNETKYVCDDCKGMFCDSCVKVHNNIVTTLVQDLRLLPKSDIRNRTGARRMSSTFEQPSLCKVCTEQRETIFSCGGCQETHCSPCCKIHDRIVLSNTHKVRQVSIGTQSPGAIITDSSSDQRTSNAGHKKSDHLVMEPDEQEPPDEVYDDFDDICFNSEKVTRLKLVKLTAGSEDEDSDDTYKNFEDSPEPQVSMAENLITRPPLPPRPAKHNNLPTARNEPPKKSAGETAPTKQGLSGLRKSESTPNVVLQSVVNTGNSKPNVALESVVNTGNSKPNVALQSVVNTENSESTDAELLYDSCDYEESVVTKYQNVQRPPPPNVAPPQRNNPQAVPPLQMGMESNYADIPFLMNAILEHFGKLPSPELKYTCSRREVYSFCVKDSDDVFMISQVFKKIGANSKKFAFYFADGSKNFMELQSNRISVAVNSAKGIVTADREESLLSWREMQSDFQLKTTKKMPVMCPVISKPVLGDPVFIVSKKKSKADVWTIYRVEENQLLCKVSTLKHTDDIRAFDVSADGTFFAVLSCGTGLVVTVYKKDQEEAAFTYKSSVGGENQGDICFFKKSGHEVLLLADCSSDCIIMLDHTKGCEEIGKTRIPRPACLAKDARRKLWVACNWDPKTGAEAQVLMFPH